MIKLLAGVILAGTLITVNGIIIDPFELIGHARAVANQANIRQFSVALDLYYIDHGWYPDVSGSAAMIAALENGKYMRTNALLDSDQFQYEPIDGGRDYSLTANQ